MRLDCLASKKILSASITVLTGLFLLFPVGGTKTTYTSLTNAEAFFFSSDLELFEEVIDLVGEKYIYAPDYKKMLIASIDQMAKTLAEKNISLESE